MFLLNFVDFQPIVTQEDGDDTGLARSAHFHDWNEVDDDHDLELEAILLQKKTKYGFLQNWDKRLTSMLLYQFQLPQPPSM
jgi:hypothetical protein